MPTFGIGFNSCTLKFPKRDHNWTGFGIHWRIFCRCLDQRNWSSQMWSGIKMISSGFSSINPVSSNVKNLWIDLTADSRPTWQGMDSWSRRSLFDGRPFLGLLLSITHSLPLFRIFRISRTPLDFRLIGGECAWFQSISTQSQENMRDSPCTPPPYI